jgi:hypothetical protein
VVEKISVSDIRFLGEQNGAAEDRLKRDISDFFRQQSGALRAYLVQMQPGADDWSVALCIAGGRNDQAHIVQSVSSIFAAAFRSDNHLDIMFVERDTEDKIRRVCPPFFEQ